MDRIWRETLARLDDLEKQVKKLEPKQPAKKSGPKPANKKK